MTPAAFQRLVSPLGRRVAMMLDRAQVRLVDASEPVQRLQVDLLDGETQEGCAHVQAYGFTSHPLPGADGVLLAAHGARANGVVICVGDRRYALVLEAGEAAVHDDQGQKVHLTRDGIVVEAGERPITLHGSKIVLDSDEVCLGGQGGEPVARVGDPVSGGVITAGSAKVSAA